MWNGIVGWILEHKTDISEKMRNLNKVYSLPNSLI